MCSVDTGGSAKIRNRLSPAPPLSNFILQSSMRMDVILDTYERSRRNKSRNALTLI